MLCAVGDLVEDIVVWLAGAPGEGTDTEARVFRSAAEARRMWPRSARRAALAARFVGHVGADDLGDRLLATLSASGVDVCVRRGGRTGTIVVLVAPGGERTMLTDRGAARDLAPIDAAWLDGVAVLHLPAYSLTEGALAETSATLAHRARAAGVRVSIDASSVAELERYGAARFLDLLADLRPDVLLTNDDEQRLLGLCDRAPEGVGLLVVHRGRGAATAADETGIVANVAP